MKQILLHTCCAPCSTWCIELLKQSYEVVMFFSNSNIFPKEEYEKRLNEARKIAEKLDVKLVFDCYCHEDWLEFVKGLENEPEKGKRCEKCFEFNIKKTAKYAIKNGFELFTTTLTVSPYKSSEKIFEIGKAFRQFSAIDFKKEDGFKKSIDLSKKHKLYRQNYCGCEFSMRKNK